MRFLFAFAILFTLSTLLACTGSEDPAQATAANLTATSDQAPSVCVAGEGDPCGTCNEGQICFRPCGVDGNGGCEPEAESFCTLPEHIYHQRVFGGFITDSICRPTH